MEINKVSEETQEQIENAVTGDTEPKGFVAQTVAGVKLALETKKLYIAAYALLFGASVGTANMTAKGTAEEAVQAEVEQIVETEITRREVLEETITALETKIVVLENQIKRNDMALTAAIAAHEHEVPEHNHPELTAGLVGLIDIAKETVPPHVHEFVPHSHQVPEHAHPTDEVVKQWLEQQSELFIGHEHVTVPEHSHKGMTEINADQYKHKDSRHDSCGLSCHLPD